LIPLADLPSLLFIWVFLVAPNRFDIVRTLITATIVGVMGTILGIWVAPWSTLVAKATGLEFAAGTGTSSMMNIFSPELFLAGVLGENFKTLGYIGVIAVLLVGIAVTIVFRLRYLKNKKAVAAA